MKILILISCIFFTVFAKAQIEFKEIQTRLEGTWIMKKKSMTIYETWKSGEGKSQGSSTSIKNDKLTFEEKLQLYIKEGAIYYSSFVNENNKWIDFKMTNQTYNEVKFENPEHDFPKFIKYTWIGKDSIIAVIGDDKKTVNFNYSRFKEEPCTSPEYDQFDFWIGDWHAYTMEGKKAGDSRITKSLNGCLVLEEWSSTMQSTSRKYEGKSFNSYDKLSRKWHQTWITNHGQPIDFLKGEFSNNEMMFYSEPYSYSKDTIAIKKLSFSKLSNGDVKQLGEILHIDKKKIKTDYEFLYKRKVIDEEKLFESFLDTMQSNYNKNDYTAVAKIYHDDAEITGGNTFEKGRMAIDKYWNNLGTEYGGKWQLTSNWVKIDKINNSATQRGKSILTGKDGSKSEVEFILNWVKTVKGWQIMQDIYW